MNYNWCRKDKQTALFFIYLRNITPMKRFIFTILTLFAAIATQAQTLQQGRDLFNKGDYQKAKPIMLKYLKQKPDDASRNYWYGVCCMETGEPQTGVEYLEKAALKNIVKSNRYLGDYYTQTEQYQSAIDSYTAFVDGMKADNSLHDQALEEKYSQMADSLRLLFRMIRNTSKVCFIDSFTVRRENVAGTLLTSASAGSFYTYQDFFESDTDGDVFMPETGNQIYYSRQCDDGHYRLFTRFKSYDSWDDETPLQGLDFDGDARYPFIMSDGTTIVFSATGRESLGGWDLFISRYNSGNHRYLTPQSVGMPFNSEGNDYFYVIDEENGLGWFASDRRQPEDTVCVYVFIHEDSYSKYNYETGDTATIHSASRLMSIRDTQVDISAVRSARSVLTQMAYQASESERAKRSFTFVIDDFNDYHEVQDFQNEDARRLFLKWEEQKKEFAIMSSQLDRKRSDFHHAGKRDQDNMRESILELENTVLEMERSISSMENQIRAMEINYLNR